MFKYLREKKLKSVIDSKENKPHRFKHFDNIQNVLILFKREHLPDIEYIAKDLASQGKKVYLWTHNPDRRAINPQIQSLDLQTITGKDVSMFGKINPELLSIFDKQQYDTIIDLTEETDFALQYLLASSKAHFNIGIKKSESKLYDFILHKNEEMSIRDTFIQIKFYLNNMCKGINN